MLLPPETIELLGAEIVMPLPLSEAKPMLQPGLSVEIGGKAIAIAEPGAL